MPGLRDFISVLDRRGKLRRIHGEVDWKYEIGSIARESDSPLLFEHIKDYPGKRLFTNGLSDCGAIALALDFKKEDVGVDDLARSIERCLESPISPVLKDATIDLGDCATNDIDLGILPVPHWSNKDAGRYIGTWHLNISRDPETGDRNVGVYRMQIVGPSQTTVSVSPRSHLARQISIAEKRNTALPMAVAIGVDERLVICAAASPPYGIDELALAGGLIGKPVELVRCKTQPLEVPSDTEVVLEGFIRPGERTQDGPFLDYAGVPNTNFKAHLFELTGLLFRNDLIFRGTAVGRPGAEDHQIYSVLSRIRLADFHGSRIRHTIQTFLLRYRAFRLFQFAGRIGGFIRNKNGKAP